MKYPEIKFGAKKGDDKKDGETEKPDDKSDEKETPKEDEGEFSKAELGKMLGSALKSGDGEAIYEAVMKCCNANPKDDE